jgi:putative FmdB family regulatory protein
VLTPRIAEETDVPTYQYACTECDAQLEVRQSFTDDALTTCPRCEGRLRKIFNAVGVVFKGSGFYRTDSRKAPDSGGANGTNGSAGSEKGSSETASSTTKESSSSAKSGEKSPSGASAA